MSKKKWEKPKLESVEIMYTLGGLEPGSQEQESYDNDWYDKYNLNTLEKVIKAFAEYGFPGEIKVS